MKRNYFMVLLVMLIFFVISFLTNILGPIIPDIIKGFSLSKTLAGFLPFAFFVAYGIMSIPSGMLVERYQEKKVIVSAFVLAFAGALLFAALPTFPVAMISLFLIGTGMAMLQVAINPLLRVSGGEENFAFFSVAAQLVFGLASYLSPMLYSHLVGELGKAESSSTLAEALRPVVPADLSWVSLYWVFALIAILMVVINGLLKFPKIERKDDEKAGAWSTHRELFRKPMIWLFFIGIFCYVGTEQGVANWMSQFLKEYHGVDPETIGARAVGNFWLFMTIGCVLGLLLLKIWDSRKILVGASLTSMAALAVALLGPKDVALIAFPAIGFFISVMWSIIVSLALNSIASHHGSFSGILCTGIAGGAVIPLIVGALADIFSLRVGIMFCFITLAYILSIGFWARPLITNATIFAKKERTA